MKITKTIFILACAFIAVSAEGSTTRAAKPEMCEAAGEFLILKNQKYALCADASCFTFNQVAYCECDLLKGDSISLPLEFGEDENVCTVNQEGNGNGYRVSTFSVPKQTEFPDGDFAVYTCPGENNKGKYGGVSAAVGSYAQCDGGLCFTSTKGNNFPSFEKLSKDEIICSCPIATNCEKSSANPDGHQIAGPYDSVTGCDPSACLRCDAAALTDLECKTGNPVSFVGIQDDLPVGAATGTGNVLSCLLLGGDVPDLNGCFCSCDQVNEDGTCGQWSVHDESPVVSDCGL